LTVLPTSNLRGERKILVAVVTAVGVPWEMRNGPEYLYEALDFLAKGRVKVIAETYKLGEAPKAYQRVVEGKARFRAVLTM